MVYDCIELVKVKNIYGSYDCKEWVEQQQQPSNGVALTQHDAEIVGVWLVQVFIVFACYAIIVKAIKQA